MITVIELTSVETHGLRRSLLRDGTASDDVVFDGDDDDVTFHLGAKSNDELLAISSWMPRRYPDLPDHTGHQLRGMATVPSQRGSGVGSTVLHAGLERCADAGSSVVWARARVDALGFYLRHGFETRGSEYVDLTTGLPHHDIISFI